MKTAQRTLFAATLLTIFSTSVMAQDVTIIYTNDLHAHVDSYKVPYVADGKRDIGGFANISTLVKQEKAKNKATFYFDAGDYFTGPYISSLTKGEAIIDIMNTMPFDAVSIGNHEFDFGLDNMARLFRMAHFPVVCANYDVTGTVLEGLVKPYVVLERGGMKIGVFGVSPKMEGLVQADKCEGIVYNDPIVAAQEVTDLLRTKEGCDVVICLSHLGFRLKNEVCDEKLAAATRGIDVILGGHSHTFMEKPAFCLNAEGKSIPVLHTGRSGIFVGELDLTLTKE